MINTAAGTGHGNGLRTCKRSAVRITGVINSGHARRKRNTTYVLPDRIHLGGRKLLGAYRSILYTTGLHLAGHYVIVAKEIDRCCGSCGFINIGYIVISAEQSAIHVYGYNIRITISYKGKQVVYIGLKIWTGTHITVGVKIKAITQQVETAIARAIAKIYNARIAGKGRVKLKKQINAVTTGYTGIGIAKPTAGVKTKSR